MNIDPKKKKEKEKEKESKKIFSCTYKDLADERVQWIIYNYSLSLSENDPKETSREKERNRDKRKMVKFSEKMRLTRYWNTLALTNQNKEPSSQQMGLRVIMIHSR